MPTAALAAGSEGSVGSARAVVAAARAVGAAVSSSGWSERAGDASGEACGAGNASTVGGAGVCVLGAVGARMPRSVSMLSSRVGLESSSGLGWEKCWGYVLTTSCSMRNALNCHALVPSQLSKRSFLTPVQGGYCSSQLTQEIQARQERYTCMRYVPYSHLRRMPSSPEPPQQARVSPWRRCSWLRAQHSAARRTPSSHVCYPSHVPCSSPAEPPRSVRCEGTHGSGAGAAGCNPNQPSPPSPFAPWSW